MNGGNKILIRTHQILIAAHIFIQLYTAPAGCLRCIDNLNGIAGTCHMDDTAVHFIPPVDDEADSIHRRRFADDIIPCCQIRKHAHPAVGGIQCDQLIIGRPGYQEDIGRILLRAHQHTILTDIFVHGDAAAFRYLLPIDDLYLMRSAIHCHNGAIHLRTAVDNIADILMIQLIDDIGCAW